ncbi:phage protease [Desulfoplanes formicivorans]|uniref:Peptidase n=1 Tax=Desulfoplanes formicivorans TaxID=1592317 RepID=A0A194AGC8_9BACT|nr:phage protease [Desulfoplanes formicivorans]GAU08136.1 hypothetical protein DPF_0839 [Desulfoplanes formicivorans]
MTWTPIFRAGTHTDSRGRTKTWTVEDLDKAIESYDPSKREAPLVIGHPKDNAPAYGWIDKLKRAGDVLLASFKQVPDELKKAVAAGRYKHKSVSFYPDGRIRHVGLLGAAQPAVEGLGEVSFSDEGDYFEYSKQEDAGVTIEELQKKLEAEKAAREAAEAKAEKLAADVAQAQAAKEREAREARIAKLVESGKVMPAEKDKVLAFAEHLGSGSENEEICFSESEGKKSLEDHFWAFLESHKGHGLFDEFKEPTAAPAEDVDLTDKV